MEPSRIWTKRRMREAWKPLAWAEIPRIACMPTGRPTMFSWRRPNRSVQGMSG